MEEPHDARPAQRREDRPRPVLHARAHLRAQQARLLDRQLGQPEHHAREHVDGDLLVDRGLHTAAEDDVPADQAGDEGVVRGLLGAGEVGGGAGGVPQEEHNGLVEERVEREVAGVLAGGFEDEGEFVAEAAGMSGG